MRPPVLLLLLVAAACVPHPARVPIGGDPRSVTMLGGHWLGEFRGAETGRTGSIAFTLTTRGDSAFGDVFMDERGNGVSIVRPADDPAAHRVHASSSKFLAISFVFVRNGEVAGRLEPYIAPDCQCVVRTVFDGRLRGDTVEGAFTTEAPEIGKQRGTWRVVRTP